MDSEKKTADMGENSVLAGQKGEAGVLGAPLLRRFSQGCSLALKSDTKRRSAAVLSTSTSATATAAAEDVRASHSTGENIFLASKKVRAPKLFSRLFVVSNASAEKRRIPRSTLARGLARAGPEGIVAAPANHAAAAAAAATSARRWTQPSRWRGNVSSGPLNRLAICWMASATEGGESKAAVETESGQEVDQTCERETDGRQTAAFPPTPTLAVGEKIPFWPFSD